MIKKPDNWDQAVTDFKKWEAERSVEKFNEALKILRDNEVKILKLKSHTAEVQTLITVVNHMCKLLHNEIELGED